MSPQNCLAILAPCSVGYSSPIAEQEAAKSMIHRGLVEETRPDKGINMRNLSRISRPILLALAGLLAASPVRVQVDVLTQRYDNARSGTNLKETKLTTSNVNKDHFGKLAFRIVDGNVYAQPLIVSGARVVKRTTRRTLRSCY